jgi:hypothetical protein
MVSSAFSYALAIAALEAVRALLVGIALFAYALVVTVLVASTAEQPPVIVIIVVATCAALVIIAAVAVIGVIATETMSTSTVRFWVGINGTIDKQCERGNADRKQLINMLL